MVLQKEQAPLSDPLLIRPPHGEGVVPSFPRLSNALPFTIFQTGSKRFSRGFTLAEVLAALAFMAIVLPVAVEGLRIANSAGVVAERKMAATEIADRVLNEAILTGQWQSGSLSGSIWRENLEFPYALRTEAWTADPMRLNLQIVTVQVTFSVQGRPYDVNLSTLAGGGAL